MLFMIFLSIALLLNKPIDLNELLNYIRMFFISDRSLASLPQLLANSIATLCVYSICFYSYILTQALIIQMNPTRF